MDINEPAELELVEDKFKEDEHKELDQKICRSVIRVTHQNLDECGPVLLAKVVSTSGGRLLPKYRDIQHSEAILANNPRLSDFLVDGWENGFKNVQRLRLLQSDPRRPKDVKYETCAAMATEKGWKTDFRGDAAQALWNHILDWSVNDSNGSFRPISRRFYAKYCAIVQSSGMGKSRCVDEMSKSHFIIPVNLRQPNSTGYPPRDHPVADYLTGSSTHQEAFLWSCSFLHALFLETTRAVEALKSWEDDSVDASNNSVATKFRNFMNDGMTHRDHGEQRKEFYANVVAKAKTYSVKYRNYFEHGNTKTRTTRLSDGSQGAKLLAEDTDDENEFPLYSPYRRLCQALENWSVDDRKLPKRPRTEHEWSPQYPYVVLVFDEAHTLTGVEDEKTPYQWSRFDELRRAIHSLSTEPLFTLFLSTSGVCSVTPAPQSRDPDPSSRIQTRGRVVTPFYGLGLDHLAIRIDSSPLQVVKLSQVTSMEQLASLGRPLWYQYFQSNKRTIVDSAAFKLLGNKSWEGQTLQPKELLACLAFRVPIEFLSAHYTSRMSADEKKQVNSHMRVILDIEDNLETLTTTSPSEPILSEAAYFVMNDKRGTKFNIPWAMKTILDVFAVKKGELGELIVALLFIMARDIAVGPPDDYGLPRGTHRWCMLTGLLNSLFRPLSLDSSESINHVDINTSTGWHFDAESKKTVELALNLADVFHDSKVYFTHFIKVHKHEIVDIDHLVCLVARGAAILCENERHGIDAIIPFLLEGDTIEKENIGVIMVQVENDIYTHEPNAMLLRDMDPHDNNMISSDVPIIRLFFALAAGTPALELVRHEPWNTARKSYRTYDFWVAGLSSDVLFPVGGDGDIWRDLLQESHP